MDTDPGPGNPVDTDAEDHRLVVEDPDLGWDTCAVVVDGDRVVSTATLLDETLRVGSVTLPTGQVDLVATDTAYEGRGLVRALMGWAHERSAARGHVLQVMLGIPYFYRLFGYEYAMDLPRARKVDTTGLAPGGALRPAEARDVPALAALQARAQAGYDVAMPHPPARWRWLLAQEASTTLVLERAGAGALLDRLRPVLADRLAASGLDRSGKDVLVSTFGAHHRMAVGDGLGEVRTGGPLQDPGEHGGAGVAPDRLADLLLGRGMRALEAWCPDVYPGPDRELFEVLFPPVTADLLTYYLDW